MGCESELGGKEPLVLPAGRSKPPARTSTLLNVAVGMWWEQKAVRWEGEVRVKGF